MLQPGQLLHDRYQLKQKLGQAAGRQTWLAEDQSVQPAEPVVVKLLLFGDSMQWDELKLFEREAQVLRQLNHPQIPKYRDSFSIDDRILWFGLVQDYIPGSSLKHLLSQGKHFNEKQVRQIATNLLHLLSYLHELSPPVLHRDIKPSNLIWGDDDYIYLVDFGAVQDRAIAEGATFTVVGTYGYAPIEQFSGRSVPASDLYALGATLIHLLTGLSPAELPQKDLRIQFADRVSLAPPFVRWIEKLAEPDVAKRFQTARQALAALRSQSTLSPDDAEPAHHSSPTPPLARTTPSVPSRSPRAPFNTQIELQQSTHSLLIAIPGTTAWSLLLLIPISIALVVVGRMLLPILTFLSPGPIAFLFFSVIVLGIVWTTYWELLPTCIQFDRDQFLIYKSPFGVAMSMSSGSTTAIQNVFHTLKTFGSGKNTYEKRVVILQSGDGEEYFGQGLSWDECSWLVDVIKDWLELR